MNFIGACLFFCLSVVGAFWLGRLSAKHEQAATATELATYIPPHVPKERQTEEIPAFIKGLDCLDTFGK